MSEIRFDLTEEEQDEDETIIGYTFDIDESGLGITEHWTGKDESWGDGCYIGIPARIWALALPWIIENMPK